jgi:hypothetical protein
MKLHPFSPKPRPTRPWLLLAALGAILCPAAHAQWVTESFALKPGWNAIWLPLDVSYEEMATAVHPDVEEMWRWNAAEAGHFTDLPTGTPSQTELQWSVWRRVSQEGSSLFQLTGNAAYLVKVADSVTPFTWNLKGKPLLPKIEWSSTGMNFVGFPMQTPASAAARSMSRFFGYDDVLKSSPPPTTLTYVGGPLSDVAPKNPLPLSIFNVGANPSFTNTAATRNQAYWIKATSYVDYMGPVKVEVGHSDGLDFADERLSTSVRVVNTVDLTRNQTVTVTLSPAASEAPPAGQAAVAGAVPLLVRGALNPATGQHSYDAFTGPVTRVLAPGESTEIIFTVKRAAMGNVAGAAFQSLINITDSLNQTRIILPVRAETASRSGLWVGAAVINSVDRIVGTTATPDEAKSEYPIRLLLHSDATGAVRFLQQAYTGEASGVPSIGTAESAFAAPDKARARTSTAAFPSGMKQLGTGALGLTGSLSFTVPLAHDDATNPFLHKYHPDHDNMDARFEQVLAAGKESPAISRSVTLTFTDVNPRGYDPSWGATQLGGTYTETITGLRAVPITCSGVFVLARKDKAAAFLQP